MSDAYAVVVAADGGSDGAAGDAPPARGGGSWTFLSNHGHVLVHVSREPQSRLRDVAEAVGITERSAQAILADLEEGGYVTKERLGRRNSYQVHPELAFRHPAEAGRPIGALLQIFARTGPETDAAESPPPPPRRSSSR